MKGFILIIVIFFIGWDAAWWLLGVKPLFPWQLKRQLDAGASDLLLLDVRTPVEFGWFHLPKARNAPNVLLDDAPLPAALPEQPVVVICMTGHRSPYEWFIAFNYRNYSSSVWRCRPGGCLGSNRCSPGS